MKYDFHNIKTAVKAAARGYDAARLYIDAGTVPIKILLLSVPDGKNPAVPAPLNEAIAAASDTLARTGDPQLVDFELDRAMFVCQARVARETGSDFLSGYVALSADAANLRALSRARRMGRGRDLFALCPLGRGNRRAGEASGRRRGRASVALPGFCPRRRQRQPRARKCRPSTDSATTRLWRIFARRSS